MQFSGGQDEAVRDAGLDEGSRYDEKTKKKPVCGTGETLERQEAAQPMAELIQNVGEKNTRHVSLGCALDQIQVLDTNELGFNGSVLGKLLKLSLKVSRRTKESR